MSESEPTPTPAELPESPLDPLAALLERQKAEIRELTKTTQKIKHAVPKGDTRRQTDAAQESANLESALYDRHTKETKELKAQLKAAAPAPAPAPVRTPSSPRHRPRRVADAT